MEHADTVTLRAVQNIQRQTTHAKHDLKLQGLDEPIALLRPLRPQIDSSLITRYPGSSKLESEPVPSSTSLSIPHNIANAGCQGFQWENT